MNRLYTTAHAVTVLAACLACTYASANTITVTPSNPAVVSAAGNTTTSAPGFSTSSFMENGNTKGEIYITSTSLFGRQVSIGEIQSISYWTNKPGGSNTVDWSLYFYTALQASGNTGSFYHTRLTSEPIYSNAAAVPANTWHQWTSGGSAPMRFYDQARDGNIQGTNSDPTFAMITGGSVTWPSSGQTVDYRGELVNFFSLQTGSDWAAGFKGLLDGLTITLNDGEVGAVNFEATGAGAVPEPASLALAGVGLVAMFAARRRTKRRD